MNRVRAARWDIDLPDQGVETLLSAPPVYSYLQSSSPRQLGKLIVLVGPEQLTEQPADRGGGMSGRRGGGGAESVICDYICVWLLYKSRDNEFSVILHSHTHQLI